VGQLAIQDATPPCVGITVDRGVVGLRLYGRHRLQRFKCFFRAGKQIDAEPCAPRSALRSLGANKLHGRVGHRREGLPEEGAQEHISVSGTHRVNRKSHVPHDVEPVAKSKDDSLLSGP